MRKTILKPLLVLSLLIATSACAPSIAATATPTGAQTAIVQTLAAVTPTPQPGIPITGGESATPTMVTSMPTAVLVTASPTATAAAGLPTLIVSPAPGLTSSPGVSSGAAQVTVSVGTNCRTGPGIAYTRVGGLPVGQVAQVVGQYPAANYWIIQNPDRPGETCWLWGQFATVSGNTAALPIIAPPVTATPNPSFDVAYQGRIINCTSTGWWTTMDLENTGGLTFKSMTLTLQDTDRTNTNQILNSDGFINNTGCNQSTTQNTLAPGQTVTVSSPVLGYNPTGHRLRATIVLCTDAKQTGTCVTQIVTLKP